MARAQAGAKRHQAAQARRVLVLRFGGLDQLILSIDALARLRAHHPSARIDMLVETDAARFAKLCPHVDAVTATDAPETTRLASSLARAIRKTGYGVIYDLTTTPATAGLYRAVALLSSRPPAWSGHVSGCTLFHDRPGRETMHPFDRMHDQLDQAGVIEATGADDRGPDTSCHPLGWVRDLQGDPPSLQPGYFSLTGPFGLIAPGPPDPQGALNWPAERYGDVAQHIAAAGLIPVLVGDKTVGRLGHEIVRIEPRTRNLITRTDPFQIAALAETASVAIGFPGSALYMAALTGTPVVALVATDLAAVERVAPRGAHTVVTHAATLRDMPSDTVLTALTALGFHAGRATPA